MKVESLYNALGMLPQPKPKALRITLETKGYSDKARAER